MGKLLVKPVLASVLSENLGLEMKGADREVSLIAPLSNLVPNALSFCKEGAPNIEANFENVIIVNAGAEPIDCSSGQCFLLSKNPRLDFARALLWLEVYVGFETSTQPASIDPTARIGKNAVIGNGVTIGAGTVILHNVVIGENVAIGCNCFIKSGAVIGEDGFGFERGADETPIRFAHLGSVKVGDNVEIGSLTTVCRGALSDTVLEDNVKIDDHVHIAHNCYIKRNAIITACAELSGGVEVGEAVWIAPNVSIMQKVKIGSKAVLGLGAVVLKDVPSGAVIVGNPGKALSRS